MSNKKKTVDELLAEALVSEADKPYEVPNNWVWSNAGAVTKTLRGVSYKKHQVEGQKNENNLLILRGGNIQDGTILNQDDNVYVSNELVKEEQKLQKNDVVIVSSTGSSKVIGKAASVINGFVGESFGAFLTAIRPSKKIDGSYFDFYYQTANYRSMISSLAKGSNINNIKKEHLDNLSFPLPPLNEQKRIAEKVDYLLGKIEEAKLLIVEAKDTFELRRAAFLDKAFRGDLTRKWRALNTVTTTATKLLDEICTLKSGKKITFNDQLDSGILETLFELPNGWKWVRLNDLIEVSTYGTSTKTNDDVSGTPVLRMGNIVDGYIELNDLKYLPNDHEDVLKYDLQTNDLLFNRTNSYELVGKTAVIGEELSGSFTFASYLIRVRLFYKDILANYVSHYINSHLGRKILLSMVTQQVGQANINSQKLASLPIPLPPKEEVVEIAKWLDNYRELENKQKEMLHVEENLEALKQSILFKAFRGELGTNDPSEENAIELLKEVLQEQVK